MSEIKIGFHKVGDHTNQLKYVVLQTRYNDQWLFVRHKERVTWEIPGGHIEAGEMPDEAASRELMEETGAKVFTTEAISDYYVTRNGETNYGRLYFCDISVLGELGESEIDEVMLDAKLPQNLTYAAIQPHLFAKVKQEKNL